MRANLYNKTCNLLQVLLYYFLRYYGLIKNHRGILMSETIKNLGTEQKVSKRTADKRYDKYLDDPLTFSLDEALQTLGPRRETIRR